MQLNECCCARLNLNGPAQDEQTQWSLSMYHHMAEPLITDVDQTPHSRCYSCFTRTFLLRTQNGVPANAMCQRQSDQRTKAPWASGAMRLGIVAGMDPHFGMVAPWGCAHPAWQAAPLQIHMPNSFSSHGSVANAKPMRQTCSLSCTNLHEID